MVHSGPQERPSIPSETEAAGRARPLKVFAVGDSYSGRRVVAAHTQRDAATALRIAVRALREFGSPPTDEETFTALSRPRTVFATRGEKYRLFRGSRGDHLTPE